MGEKKTFTCQNSACKGTFTTPLKTVNLQEDPSESYFACPICLTKIDDFTTEEQETPIPQVESQSNAKNENSEKGSKIPDSCNHYIGYLSERSQKEQIPDNCWVCPKIVDCMLKRINE
jgi:hypothetical protein